MSKINDGGPVYPCATFPKSAEQVREIRDAAGIGLMQARDWASMHSGMSLRDAAALAALQGMLAYGVGFRPAETPDLHWHNVVAREAWAVADAFIAARETKEDER
jgi:hypothetical protein